jgi:glycosyltransferase involved in cell wall biosynthesis
MSRIGILSLTIAPGDAVGHDALEMCRVLTALGHEVELFSCHGVQESKATRDFRELPAYLDADPSALLLYHHAIGWDAGAECVLRARCRRIVCYHNVTPGRFFAGYAGRSVLMCWRGREQLAELARAGCELYLSDSGYNQSELLVEGAPPERCVVVPPFHQVDHLANAEPDPGVLAQCADWVNLLFVGRRAPNKGHRFLIDAFAAYAEHYSAHSRLILLGKEDPSLAEYGLQLREQARRLGVEDRVVLIDRATDAELRAWYASAAALVVTSEHEGFCVPAIEAMALGVPVVAWGTTAVTDTVGDAGLVWDDPEPFLLAQSIDTVVRDADVRALLTRRGLRRYRERFSTPQIEAAFLAAFAAVSSPAA